MRRERTDLFLVACKATAAGATPDGQYLAGLRLLKSASANLVLANDTRTRLSMVVTPDQARYHETTDRAASVRAHGSHPSVGGQSAHRLPRAP